MRPVPDFAHAKSVCFRQITKGPAPIDPAIVGKRYRGKPPTGKNSGWLASELVRNNVAHSSGPWPNQKHTDLSIEAEPGVALYMVSLDNMTGTRFGPNANPIQLFPLEYSSVLLKDVGLIFQNLLGQPVFVDAADIPTQYGFIPASAMLTFTLDRKELESAWDLNVVQAGHNDYALKVPFFLDLYDVNTGRPIWAIGDPSPAVLGSGQQTAKAKNSVKKMAAGGANPQPATHGGIHPRSAMQFFY